MEGAAARDGEGVRTGEASAPPPRARPDVQLVPVTEATDGSRRAHPVPVGYRDPATMLARLERLPLA